MRRVGYDAQAFLSPNRGTGKGVQLRNLLARQRDALSGSRPALRTGPARAGAEPEVGADAPFYVDPGKSMTWRTLFRRSSPTIAFARRWPYVALKGLICSIAWLL